jgi:hypothetical protein
MALISKLRPQFFGYLTISNSFFYKLRETKSQHSPRFAVLQDSLD